jgi:hypothetical protein
MFRPTAILLASLLAALAGPAALAQAKPEKAKAKPAVTERREESALDFARANHPELAELLERLRTGDRAAYDKAIREIAATNERLEKFRESDPERYELAVRNWTRDSRIRLLTARLTMSDDPELRAEIESLLRDRRQGKLDLLRLERRRLTGRLEKLDTQIDQLERGGAASVEQELARIDRTVKAAKNRRAAQGGKPKKKSNGK